MNGIVRFGRIKIDPHKTRRGGDGGDRSFRDKDKMDNIHLKVIQHRLTNSHAPSSQARREWRKYTIMRVDPFPNKEDKERYIRYGDIIIFLLYMED